MGMLERSAAVLAAVLLLCALSLSLVRAHAETVEVDPDRTDCSITFTMQYTDTVKNADGTIISSEKKATKSGALSLYTVGTVKTDNGYYFDTSEGKFSGVEGVSDLEKMTTEELDAVNSEMSQKLEKLAKNVEADQNADITDGKVSFTGLKPGLYLIVQTTLSEGEFGIRPFLVTIPDSEGSFNIEAAPKPGDPERTVTKPRTPDKPDPVLPQTGQLWWPVPVMCGGGVILIAVGLIVRRVGRARA